MDNILDYLRWRGDLSLADQELGEADHLALARLSYAPFDGIVPEGFGDRTALSEACSRCLELLADPADGRRVRIDEDADLLRAMGESERFGRARLCGFVNRFDPLREEQFCAVTALMPRGGICVVFRGTDGTLVGWKEDFNMGFMERVPAQLDALEYLRNAAAAFPRAPITVCGHSKGGNLAVYSAAFCEPDIQRRIAAVRNLDGPGFLTGTVATDGFRRISDRVHTFIPQSSVIGMLLSHEEAYTVVHSANIGIWQHNLYSWEVVRNGFSPVSEVTDSSQIIDRTLKDWMSAMSPEQRGRMIDVVFGIVGSSDATTLRELMNGRNTLAMVRAMAGADEETLAVISEGLTLLKDALKRNLPTLRQLGAELPWPHKKQQGQGSADAPAQ